MRQSMKLKSGFNVFSLVILFFLITQTNLISSAFAQTAPSKGQEIFIKNCEVCHSIGAGRRVGPDLMGVTKHREEEWLKKFIQHPTQMIDSKDQIAMDLLGKYQTPMPDRGLTDEETVEILKYLDSFSITSSTTETTKIIKKTASKENINKGMALFQGTQRFLRQGPSCISCHNVRTNSVFAGGALAKDLTTSYSRLGEAGINSIIKNPPFPVMHEAYANKELTNEEINFLNDFLGNVDEEQKPTDYQSDMLTLSIICLLVLFLYIYFIIWAVGK